MATSSRAIRFVTFDALYTLFKPRAPIPVQYTEAFAANGLGTLDPDQVGRSFKTGMLVFRNATAVATPVEARLSAFRTVYQGTPDAADRRASPFWTDVISRTAIDAGADVEATKAALPTLVPQLLERFNTDKGYKLYPDTLKSLSRLRKSNMSFGLISNGDNRILNVLSCFNIELSQTFKVSMISEQEGIAKPDKRIFERAAFEAGVEMHQIVHIGDELENDYHGAKKAGMHALLLRRQGKDEAAAHEDRAAEKLEGVMVVRSLTEAIDWVEAYNKQHSNLPEPNL